LTTTLLFVVIIGVVIIVVTRGETLAGVSEVDVETHLTRPEGEGRHIRGVETVEIVGLD
jgi:hypothetical protein